MSGIPCSITLPWVTVNMALDEVRAGESRKMAQEGHEPLLKISRCCVMKRKEDLTSKQQVRLRDLLRYSLQPSAPTYSKKIFSNSGNTLPPLGPACSWTSGAIKPCAVASSR